MDLIGAKRPCLLQAIAPSGFINLGNTCYLNASLKAIFNQPLLCSLIERRATTGDALIEKLDAILSLYRQEEDASDALASVFSDPQVISWGYHVGPEFDADELCRRLFSLLGVSDELSASIHVSDEPATSILPLHPESENPFSIQELIDLQLRERLIHLYPQALSFLGIQIARFQGRGRKNYAPLIDPLAPIVLSVVTPENPPVTSTVTLAPSSFICHKGTLNSGHYITITKDGENNYLVHDDLHVYSITEQKAQELASKHAYIIFYSV
jgi:hypothetical protein